MIRIPKPARLAAAAAAAAVAGGAWVVLAPGTPPEPRPPAAAATPAPPTADPASAAQAQPAKTTVLALFPGSSPEQACSAEGAWCVYLTAPDDEGLRRPLLRPAADADQAPADPTDAGETFAVWPKLIALGDGGFLAGVETRLSTSYSGGGGSATQLRLFRVSKDQPASDPVLVLPIQGSLLIRACFSEADLEKRGEACHDEYGFTGKLEIEPGGAALPAIAYATTAWAFPRGASRSEDSTTRGALASADLVRAPDERCSFRRRFVFDSRTRTYQPDRPLPDCSDYTVP